MCIGSKAAEITPEFAEAMMLRSFERGIVSHRMLPDVIQEWRNPGTLEFAPRGAVVVGAMFHRRSRRC